MMLSRSPRAPVSRSYSRLLGPAIMVSMCCSAGSASRLRPRLVWMTVPVRLSTARIRGCRHSCTRSCSLAESTGKTTSSSSTLPPITSARWASSKARASPATSVWPCSASNACTAGSRSSRSTEGRSRGWAVCPAREPCTTDSSGRCIIAAPDREPALPTPRTAAAGSRHGAAGRFRPPAGPA